MSGLWSFCDQLASMRTSSGAALPNWAIRFDGISSTLSMCLACFRTITTHPFHLIDQTPAVRSLTKPSLPCREATDLTSAELSKQGYFSPSSRSRSQSQSTKADEQTNQPAARKGRSPCCKESNLATSTRKRRRIEEAWLLNPQKRRRFLLSHSPSSDLISSATSFPSLPSHPRHCFLRYQSTADRKTHSTTAPSTRDGSYRTESPIC